MTNHFVTNKDAVKPFDFVGTGVKSEALQVLAAALLGVVIILAVGFLPTDAVHNAAHDTRHAFAFPCH